MPKFILLFLLQLVILSSYSQVPQGINYQAVVRDNQGSPIVNTSVAFRFNIRSGSIGGTIVYAERFALTTNAYGVANLVIGQGTPISGTFSSINWSTGSYFNEVLLDPNGGNNYTTLGTSQLMSVPYALYAEKTQESQNLTLNGNSLTISGGNTVTLPFNSGSTGAYPQKIARGVYPSNISIPSHTHLSSEPDGSTFYFTTTVSSSSSINSYERDATTGFYFLKGSTSVASTLCGATYTTPIGNYLYACVKPTVQCATSQCKFYRLEKNNLGASPTLMSVVGALPISNGGPMFTDGNFLYVADNNNVFKKYAISGTTLTDNGAYVMTDFSSITFPGTVSYDGTNIITYSNSDGVCSKFTLSGTLLNSITRKSDNAFDGARYNNSFVINLTNNSLFLVDYCLPTNGSNQDGEQFLKLTPISKP